MSQDSIYSPGPIPEDPERLSAWIFELSRKIGEAYHTNPEGCPPIIETLACINRITAQRRTIQSDILSVIMEMLQSASPVLPTQIPDPVCIPPDTMSCLMVYRILTDRVAIGEDFLRGLISSAYARRRELESSVLPPLPELPEEESFMA